MVSTDKITTYTASIVYLTARFKAEPWYKRSSIFTFNLEDTLKHPIFPTFHDLAQISLLLDNRRLKC